MLWVWLRRFRFLSVARNRVDRCLLSSFSSLVRSFFLSFVVKSNGWVGWGRICWLSARWRLTSGLERGRASCLSSGPKSSWRPRAIWDLSVRKKAVFGASNVKKHHHQTSLRRSVGTAIVVPAKMGNGCFSRYVLALAMNGSQCLLLKNTSSNSQALSRIHLHLLP